MTFVACATVLLRVPGITSRCWTIELVSKRPRQSGRQLRIALVAPNYHPRTCGVGDYAMRVAQELIRRGHETIVLSRPPMSVHPEAPEVPVRALDAPTASLRAMQAAAEIRRLETDHVLIQYTPHMLGATRFGNPAISVLAAVLRASGVKVTTIAHELYVPWRLRPDLAAAAALHRAELAALTAATSRLFVTTETRLAKVRRFAPPWVAWDRFGVVPVGANANPAPAARRPGTLLFGTFTTLDAGKKLGVLLDAFQKVGATIPESELIFIGDTGPESDRRRQVLEAAIAGHPFRNRIRTTGKLALGDVAEAVASLTVFLFPNNTGATTKSGTLPLALGSAIPVVAIRGSETDPCFRDDDNVVFAEGLNGEAFAAATLRILNDSRFAARVAAAGRRLYEERLTWPTIVDRILDSPTPSSENTLTSS